ncbi:AQP10 protein, partial [Anhinga anhinga]|nr:AQP10 protein [Anhinga anhinga]
VGTASFLKRDQALLRIRNHLVRECLAELPAIVTLILMAPSGSAQVVTSSGPKGNVLSAWLVGTLAITAAVYTVGGASGAHLNAAFSLATCPLEQFPWWKFPLFVAVRTSGAFLSTGAIYALCCGTGRRVGTRWGNTTAVPGWLCPRSADTTWHYSNGTLAAFGPRETASVFAAYPAGYLSLSNSFLDQVMGTAPLIAGVLDTHNKGVPKGLKPAATALLTFSIAMAVGFTCSCPMNPTQAFGPWLFTYTAGWDTEVFRWVK